MIWSVGRLGGRGGIRHSSQQQRARLHSHQASHKPADCSCGGRGCFCLWGGAHCGALPCLATCYVDGAVPCARLCLVVSDVALCVASRMAVLPTRCPCVTCVVHSWIKVSVCVCVLHRLAFNSQRNDLVSVLNLAGSCAASLCAAVVVHMLLPPSRLLTRGNRWLILGAPLQAKGWLLARPHTAPNNTTCRNQAILDGCVVPRDCHAGRRSRSLVRAMTPRLLRLGPYCIRSSVQCPRAPAHSSMQLGT